MCRSRKKKNRGGVVLMAADANLLDIKYEFDGFDNDLRDTTNEYHCHKTDFCKNKYRFCCCM